MRAFRIARDALESHGFVERGRRQVMRTQADRVKSTARVFHQALDDCSPDASAPVRDGHVESTNAADGRIIRERVAVQTTHAADAPAQPRDVSTLARAIEAVAAVAPFADEPTHHPTPVRLRIRRQCAERFQIMPGFDGGVA